MWARPVGKLLTLAILVVLATTAKAGQQTASVTLTQMVEDATQYSLIISDSDERNVSGIFSIEQIKVLQAVMVEARKFALTNEASSSDGPRTTRFVNQQEPAFIVDVEKFGSKSEIFLTLNSETGTITVNIGIINRVSGKGTGTFFDLLSRVDSAVAKSPKQTPR